MSPRPLIGLTGRRKTGAELLGNPEPLHGLDGDWFYADYARGVWEAGGLPVNLPLDIDPAVFAERLDGVLLSGGADIGPGKYGADAETDLYPPEAERDDFELSLLGAAIDRELPVVGICRGLQMINVHAGGTLHQHVPEHAMFDEPAGHVHAVEFAADSTLADLYGREMQVNSLHHQTVDQLGADLRITASHGDSVEGLEHISLPIVAVQWHPEMLPSRNGDPLFGWLVAHANERAA